MAVADQDSRHRFAIENGDASVSPLREAVKRKDAAERSSQFYQVKTMPQF